MKRGKRYVDSAKKIDRTVQYESADAIKLVKENATAKFDETIGQPEDIRRSARIRQSELS